MISATTASHHPQTVTPASHRSPSLAKLVRTALVICLLFPFSALASWTCPTPQGSYLNSCNSPTGVPYQSTDPNLANVKFCQYMVDCQKVGKPHFDKRTSRKILPREDLACGTNWENCDGHLIARATDTRFCTDAASIQAQLKEHGLIEEEHTPTREETFFAVLDKMDEFRRNYEL